MSPKPVQASVGGRQLMCLVCGDGEFTERPVKLNTAGAEFFGIEFLGDSLELYDT